MYCAAAIACVTTGCVLLACAVNAAFHPAPLPTDEPLGVDQAALTNSTPGLLVEDAERNVGDVEVGDHVIHFRVTNRSGQPGEIVGGTGRCGLGACFTPRNADRVALRPDQAVEVDGVLEVRRAGAFEAGGDLYLNDGGRLRTVRLKITGVGVEPKRKPNPAPVAVHLPPGTRPI